MPLSTHSRKTKEEEKCGFTHAKKENKSSAVYIHSHADRDGAQIFHFFLSQPDVCMFYVIAFIKKLT